jgi:hypothetical protein
MDRWIEFDGGLIEVVDQHGYAAGTGDTIRVTCRGSDGSVRWVAELPSRQPSILVPLSARAEVHGGVLFVVWDCEHQNAGGSPYFATVGTVWPGGRPGWVRMVDALGRSPTIRVVGEVVEITAGWTTSPFDRTPPPLATRRLDLTTGLDRSSP